ncbi:DUF4760 domain-containing protein [Gillisia hiemivivida]
MFLERIAIFSLQAKEKLDTFLNYLIRETNSQIGPLLFLGCVFLLTLLLYYVWITPYAFWAQIVFTFIFILCLLICASVMYFHITQKRVRRNSNTLEVFSLAEDEIKKFDLNAIPLNEVQVNNIFKAFSENHLSGDYQTFQAFIQLKPVSRLKRLVWKDSSYKLPKQVNRQTLLEFLSQILVGFENLENQQMIELTNYYFILKNSEGKELTFSTKNIYDWKNNKSSYLENISALLKKNL